MVFKPPHKKSRKHGKWRYVWARVCVKLWNGSNGVILCKYQVNDLRLGSKVLGSLRVAQVVMKFPAFYDRAIIIFTAVYPRYLSWDRWIQPAQFIFKDITSRSPSRYSKSSHFLFFVILKFCTNISSLQSVLHAPPHHQHRFDFCYNIWWRFSLWNS